MEGKNRAIHAYDDIVWKIRSGFLTLLMGGWAITLKGITESNVVTTANHAPLVFALLLFSFGFAFGAWFIDRNYIRRKFRVILALDAIIDELADNGGEVATLSPQLLKVSGDDALMPFDCPGYRQARRAELAVYLAPLVFLVAGVVLVMSGR
jgi:hypothetical protein